MELPSHVRPFQLYGEERADYVPDLVHLEKIAARASLHNWVIGAHRHPSIVQLLYIERGRGVLVTEAGELALGLPSMVLMPCDCPHAFRFGSDAQGWVLSVAVALLYDPRLAITDKDRFLQRGAIERIALTPGDDQARLVRLLFRDIERRRVDGNILVTDGVLAALSMVFSLAQEISSAAVERRDATLGPRRALFRRFMPLVEQSYRDGLSVGSYARALGTSQATLTRACREVTGKPPGALVNERRLLEAKRSLSFTTASVKQIADDLGYDDPAYFARSFRQHTGTTASEFRRRTMRPVPRR
jgi:AraC family transcriptional activator of pobA